MSSGAFHLELPCGFYAARTSVTTPQPPSVLPLIHTHRILRHLQIDSMMLIDYHCHLGTSRTILTLLPHHPSTTPPLPPLPQSSLVYLLGTFCRLFFICSHCYLLQIFFIFCYFYFTCISTVLLVILLVNRLIVININQVTIHC